MAYTSFELKMLGASWGLLALAALNSLDVCLGILLEHYAGLYYRYCQKRHREQNYDPGKQDQLSGLALQLLRQFFLFLGNRNKCGYVLHKPIRLSGQFISGFLCLIRNPNVQSNTG